MKKIFILFAFIISGTAFLLNSCAPTKQIAEKTGTQLWGENCNRCHNSPTMEQYNKQQWDIIIVTHMKREAGLTDIEVNKIVDFLKQSGY